MISLSWYTAKIVWITCPRACCAWEESKGKYKQMNSFISHFCCCWMTMYVYTEIISIQNWQRELHIFLALANAGVNYICEAAEFVHCEQWAMPPCQRGGDGKKSWHCRDMMGFTIMWVTLTWGVALLYAHWQDISRVFLLEDPLRMILPIFRIRIMQYRRGTYSVHGMWYQQIQYVKKNVANPKRCRESLFIEAFQKMCTAWHVLVWYSTLDQKQQSLCIS